MSTANNGSAMVESLAEVFCCFICMDKLSDACLCPHCSKLCCYPCIRRWLNGPHQQCPHCQRPLHLQDIVKCPWADSITIQLDTLKPTESHKYKQKNEEKDKCESHNEKLTVYCSSCSKCICHQCALFNGYHSGHVFLPLDDVYKTNLTIINEHLKQLKRRQVEFICLVEDIERNIEKIKTGRDERFREIRNVMRTMENKLEEQFQMKFEALNDQYAQISREAELIEHTLHDIEHRIATVGKAEIIHRQKDFLNSIKTLCHKPITNSIPTPISYDFPSEMIPEYHSRTFIIKNFSIHQENLEPIYSQTLEINGLIWRLKVYPYGNGSVRGTYLSVFLELIHGLNETYKYEYRIEMIHQLSNDLTKNILREFSSNFDIGECWGYNKFFLLNHLRTEGFLDNDTLILRFQVRSPTYQEKSRDQQWYIKQLKNNNEQLNNEIQNLKEQLQKINPVDNDNDQYTTFESDENNSKQDKNLLDNAVNNRSVINSQSAGVTINSDVNLREHDSTLSLITDEDFILADILERSAHEEPNTNISGEFCTSLNNLIMLNTQIYQSRIIPDSD